MFFLQKDITKDQKNLVGFEGGEGVHGRLAVGHEPTTIMPHTQATHALCQHSSMEYPSLEIRIAQIYF